MTNLEEEKREQKNTVLAIILVIVVLMGGNYFWPKPTQIVSESLTPSEQAELMPESVSPVVKTETAVVKNEEIPFANDFVSGRFNTLNTSFNTLSLLKYKESTEPDSPSVSLLSSDFYTTLDWVSGQGDFSTTSVAPVVSGKDLTPFTPVVLTWTKGTVTLERTVSMDDAYLITFTDKITNAGSDAVQASLTGRVVRTASSVSDKQSVVHEGFLGYFNNREVEYDYSDVTDSDDFETQNKGGWIGITDKYWQTVFVPEQSMAVTMTFSEESDDYVAAFRSDEVIVGAGQTVTTTTKLFAGAKDLTLLNDYAAAGIPRFDLSIDFGWYYFLTKPFLYLLGWLNSLIGNMGVVILIFATLLRILLLPMATKSYESMAKMKKIQPKIKALQERFKDNRQQLQIEMMNLYKRDKVNPASGCLPMLIQIPVFFALYKVLSVSILMRQAPFFGWIHDLSQPDPSSVFTVFGYLPWPIPGFLNIGVWPVLMGLTMVIQQRLSPAPTANKEQKMMMTFLPIIFTFMMGNFASGLVIYWTWSNILSIAQQKYIMKKVGV